MPRNFIPAVEKGVHEALHEGALAHFPMVDLRVTLFDGKEHPVDSSEMAFKIAGSQALKQGALKANPVLLEPVMELKIRVPDGNTGDVMSDLNGKRAKVHGMSPEGDGTTIIDAEAPLAEVLRYATDLRSITQGRGSFEMTFHHYDEVPQHIAQKVIAEAQKAREAGRSITASASPTHRAPHPPRRNDEGRARLARPSCCCLAERTAELGPTPGRCPSPSTRRRFPSSASSSSPRRLRHRRPGGRRTRRSLRSASPP